MAMCWNIQDGMSLDNKENILETLNRLYGYGFSE